MKRYLFSLVLALLPMLGFSQHRSESDAITVAQKFWGGKVNRARLKAVSHVKLSNAKAKARAKENIDTSIAEPGCYIINDSENCRFVIVSAHQRMSDVLGYSDEGLFNVDNIAPGLMDILLSYDAVFDYLMEHPDAEVASNEGSTESYTPVEPLITTKWGQGYPYNQECPIIYDTHCETGCGATALAQVLNYYRSSTHGSGELYYTTNSKKIEEFMNFEGLDINWDAIQDTYDDSSTEEQRAEVAKLMHACGVSLAMDYNAGGSGTNYSTFGYALTKFWNYNPNIAYKHASVKYEEPLEDQMRKELSIGHPILAILQGTFEGHVAVVDGYDSNGWFHYNFGWEGVGDGYYKKITFVRPLDEDGNSLFYWFIYNHYIVNIAPEECGEPDADYFVANNVPTYPSSIAIGCEQDIKYTINVYGVHTPCSIYGLNEYFNSEIGIGLFNDDGTLSSILMAEQASFCPGMTITLTCGLKFDSKNFKEGERYYLTPYYKLEDSDKYYWIKNNDGNRDDEGYYAVHIKDGIVYLVRGDEYSSDSFKEVSTRNEIPGHLADNVNTEDLNRASLWSISGNINGTDIKYILASMPDDLVCLNLSACNIIEGGDAYYSTYWGEYFTETNVVGPEMLSSLGKLSTVKLPLSTKIIRKNAINNNWYLNSLTIPDACEVVEDSAIYNCRSLVVIHLGKNVREFGSANGIDCYGFQGFSIEEDNTNYKTENGILYSYDGTFLLRCPEAHNNNESNTFTVPEEVVKIEDYAFWGVKNASYYELHDGIQEIGKYAFAHSYLYSLNLPENVSEIAEGLCQDAHNLSSVYLPKGIKTIYPNAFSGCSSLKKIESEIYDIEDVVILNENKMSNAFQGISKTCHWRVPLGSVEIYRAQKWWVDTWTIEESVPESISMAFNDGLKVHVVAGGIHLKAYKPCILNIYDVQGRIIKRIDLTYNSTQFIRLTHGIYVVNGQKIMIN